jgi:hypothetical protein
MSDGVACTEETYEFDSVTYARVANGGKTCRDCLAPPNSLHHPGCDEERCPVCGNQAISCPCGDNDDVDDDEDFDFDLDA